MRHSFFIHIIFLYSYYLGCRVLIWCFKSDGVPDSCRQARHALRSRLQCKPFRWFVDAVNSAEYYAPDPQGRVEMFKVSF